MSYDSIVVGGGAAGAVVAARLSEDPDRRVLLLEAGPDYPYETPGDLLDASAPVTSGHNWDMRAIAGEGDGASSESMGRVARVLQRAATHLGTAPGANSIARLPYPLGKVMGGGSAINGGLAFHARPEDFAAWVAGGNHAWSWEQVRPYIGRIEGADGRKPAMPMETDPPEGLTRYQEAFLAACLDRGHPRVDLREGTASGVGLIPRNVSKGRRVSTAKLYLTGARGRPNLTIQPRCLVDKLFFEPRNGRLTAGGVEALVDSRRCRFSGGEIVLAAGTVNSPAILLRSGIGAAGEISRVGGKPLLDLPGVGRNLVEHPAVSIWAVPGAGTCREGEPVHQVMLQQRSAESGSLCDLQMFMLSALPTERLPPLRDVVGEDLAIGISVIVATPVSRGRVELLDLDPTRNPRVHLNCMSEASDLARMTEGLRSAWSLLEGDLGRSGIERIVLWSQSVVDSDLQMEKMIRSTLRGAWHPVGTLRMGSEGDGTAVVDQRGRLFGCGNVTVADGSIMPSIPSVPTNLTCMLIGERISAFLRGEG